MRISFRAPQTSTDLEIPRTIGSAKGGPLGDLTYQYDGNGNRIATGGAFARTLVPAAIATSTYDAANQQLAFGSLSQTFDANGNLLTQTDPSGTTTYTWDARNRLTGITGPTLTASFAYDALGRRISKTINGTTTTFLYDGLDIVGESTGGSTATYLRTLNIDEALTRTDGSGTNAYLADVLGSTVALATGGGTLATAYSYEPFGRTETTGTPSPNAFRFTGREDDSTGLYYYRARYYDPTRSRFVSPDPIGFAGGDMDLYTYAHNRPLNDTDPSGLDTYRCKRPLQGLDDVGQKSGPEWPRNPLYHEFICVKVGGKTICGGQTMAPHRLIGHAIPWGPGARIDDYYDPRHCEKTSENKCMEACLLTAIDGSRPWYGLIGPGTNCQEWAGQTYGECARKCGDWH